MKKEKVVLITLMLSSLVLCSGCSSSIKGAGSDTQAKYTWGTLEAQLDYPVLTTYEAAEKAVSQLELAVLIDEHDKVAGRIVARDAQNKDIMIKLGALPSSRTTMSIRIGTFGDKNKSNVIYNQIIENLRQDGENLKS